jgi:hypothetical protein
MRNPTPLSFDDDYPFEEASKKTSPKPEPSIKHRKEEFIYPSKTDAASLSEYRLLIIRHVRNTYFMEPYFDTISNLSYFMRSTITLHKITDANRTHDIIDEFKLLVNNLSTIVESMQDMMRVFIPDGMMTFRRDQWDRWTLLDLIRAIVEDKSPNTISRSTSCAKLLSTIMPIELADEIFQLYQIEIDGSKDFNRIESWSKSVALLLSLKFHKEDDQLNFLRKLKKLPNDQILFESQSKNNKFLEQKNKIATLVAGNRDIFVTWTRKVNSLRQCNFEFSLFYMDKIKSGDPSVQPKKLELKHPILDKVLYERDLHKEEFLQFMFSKCGYSLYDTRTNMNALIKRLSQQIGLLLTDFLHLFRSKTESLATIFLTEEVLQAIFKEPFCQNADALFTITGKRPAITLYCVYSGRHSTYEVFQRPIILTIAKYRNQETFVLGAPSIIKLQSSKNLGKRIFGIHGIPGEVIIIFSNNDSGEYKNSISNLNLLTGRCYLIATKEGSVEPLIKLCNNSDFLTITQIEGCNDLLVCNEYPIDSFFLLKAYNHTSGRYYNLIRFSIS